MKSKKWLVVWVVLLTTFIFIPPKEVEAFPGMDSFDYSNQIGNGCTGSEFNFLDFETFNNEIYMNHDAAADEGVALGCGFFYKKNFDDNMSSYDFIYEELLKSYYSKNEQRMNEGINISDITKEEVEERLDGLEHDLNQRTIKVSDIQQEAEYIDQHFGETFTLWRDNYITEDGEEVYESPTILWETDQSEYNQNISQLESVGIDNPQQTDHTSYKTYGSDGFFTNGFGTMIGECESYVNEEDDRDEPFDSDTRMSDIDGDYNELLSEGEKLDDTVQSNSNNRVTGALADGTTGVVGPSVGESTNDGNNLTGINCADFGIIASMTKIFDPVNITNVKPVMKGVHFTQNIAIGVATLLIAIYGIYLATGNLTVDPFKFVLKGFGVVFIVAFLPYFAQDILNINNFIVYQIGLEGISAGDGEAKAALGAVVAAQALNFALVAVAQLMFFGVGISLLLIGALVLIFLLIIAAKVIITLLFWWYSRMLTIFFLVILGPIFMVLMLFPKTAEYGSKWIKMFTSETLSQSLFVLALFTISQIFSGLGDITRILDINLLGSVFLVYAGMIFLSKIPSIMQNLVGPSLGAVGWNDAVGVGNAAGNAVKNAGMAATAAGAQKYRMNQADKLQDMRQKVNSGEATPAEENDYNEKLQSLSKRSRRMDSFNRIQDQVKNGKLGGGNPLDDIRQLKSSEPVDINHDYSQSSQFTSARDDYMTSMDMANNKQTNLDERIRSGGLSRDSEEAEKRQTEIDNDKNEATNKLKKDIIETMKLTDENTHPLMKEMKQNKVFGDIKKKYMNRQVRNSQKFPQEEATEENKKTPKEPKELDTIYQNMDDVDFDLSSPSSVRHKHGISDRAPDRAGEKIWDDGQYKSSYSRNHVYRDSVLGKEGINSLSSKKFNTNNRHEFAFVEIKNQQGQITGGMAIDNKDNIIHNVATSGSDPQSIKMITDTSDALGAEVMEFKKKGGTVEQYAEALPKMGFEVVSHTEKDDTMYAVRIQDPNFVNGPDTVVSSEYKQDAKQIALDIRDGKNQETKSNEIPEIKEEKPKQEPEKE
ncbi:type IV secretion system protein [Alkalibacillus aidingensis]|uniref:type IV secretion system protein n=1 Tax=Alkalibacillus aidingensis TaxID=2747607 RepID=UPI0016607078|nr:type IV secretion system protein [Alkalibacillus aidingensis]